MTDDIQFREGTATKEEIRGHLEQCDADFRPNLSSKVNIEQYATKIRSRAQTFEAWLRNDLIGLVAIYLNDRTTRTAFVTSVSVSRQFTGRGIAAALLGRALERARQTGMVAVRLEVGTTSVDAIRLYTNLGFAEIACTAESVSMELEIRERRQL